MIDIVREINAIRRETGVRGVAKTITLQRTYDAPVEDVWDAVTNPDRINRWFLPVTGDFRLGGQFQFKDNAGGEILRCEPPSLLKVTWVMGEQAEGDMSEVEVRLSPADGGGTTLVLDHVATVPAEMWGQFGPGAVGVGWDGGLLGLGLHLQGGDLSQEERDAWGAGTSPEARDFMTRSSEAWGAAFKAAGATDEEVAAAIANTTGFYVP